MSALLNKRLARSLWRTKLRLLAVVMMVSVGVFAGITFGGYSHNLDGMYETLQADDEDGANLADLWIDNRSGTWSAEETADIATSSCASARLRALAACRYLGANLEDLAGMNKLSEPSLYCEATMIVYINYLRITPRINKH